MPYKRKGSEYWQIVVCGVRRSSRTRDKRQATELEHKLCSEAWQRQNLGGVRFATWDEACKDWFLKNATLRAIDKQGYLARWWTERLSKRRLHTITPELVESFLEQPKTTGRRKNQPGATRLAKIPQNSTANQLAMFVGKILRHAKRDFEFKYYPVPEGRDEWLKPEHWPLLLPVMSEDLRHIATFSLGTGLREANVMGLQWEWVRGDYLLIPAAVAKTEKPYGIPLNKTVQGVIEERRKMAVVHARNVFTRAGTPWYVQALLRDWHRATDKAGLARLRFHDLRHTWASWMAHAGVPYEIRARLGCWKLGAMPDRYTHFDVTHLRPYAEVFDTIYSTLSAGLQDSQRLAG